MATKKSESKSKDYTHRPKGVHTGLYIKQQWHKLFMDNCKAAKKDRKTDQQILDAMLREFPNRNTTPFTIGGVQRARREFNANLLVPTEPHKLTSVRYDENGEPVTVRPGRAPWKTNGKADAKAKKAKHAPTAKKSRAEATASAKDEKASPHGKPRVRVRKRVKEASPSAS